MGRLPLREAAFSRDVEPTREKILVTMFHTLFICCSLANFESQHNLQFSTNLCVWVRDVGWERVGGCNISHHKSNNVYLDGGD